MGFHLRRFTTSGGLSQNTIRKMKLSLALFLLIALVVILFPEDSEASPARRRQQLARGARKGVQARRRGVGRKAGRRAKFGRRGRTAHPDPAPEALPDEDVPVEDENALDEPVEGTEAGDDGVEGEEGEEGVPTWCNPSDPMGAWLNFKAIRTICGDRGFSDFGPYGGIPADLEEDMDEAVEAGDEEAIEEVVEELERRRRRRRRRRMFRKAF